MNVNFEIAALLLSPYRWGKSAAISKLESFLTEWSRSYIVFALATRKLANLAYLNSIPICFRSFFKSDRRVS